MESTIGTVLVPGLGRVPVVDGLGRYRELMSTDDRQKFWLGLRGHWPDDQPERVFLGRAVDIIGRAMFQQEWTGHEPSANDHLAALPPLFMASRTDKENAWWLLGRVIEHGRHGPPKLEFTAEEWREAKEKRAASVAEIASARARFAAAKSALRQRFMDDPGLATFTRALAGGFVSKEPVSRALWLTETWEQRFYYCRIDVAAPFSAHMLGSQWLFVDGVALEAATRKLTVSTATTTSAKRRADFHALLLGEVKAHERNPFKRRHWQDRAKSEFGIAREAFDKIWGEVTPGTKWSASGAKPKAEPAE